MSHPRPACRAVAQSAATVGLLSLATLAAAPAAAQTFFYTGPANGDFFDEANWTANADGTGASPAGDPLIDSSTNAIALDLIVDGDTVTAPGQVDFGTGSLTLGAGSTLNVTGAGNDLDINADSTFSLTDATLIVDDIINLEGISTLTGGQVTASTDDVAFQDNFTNLTIVGTTFTAADNIYFDGMPTSITNATFNSSDRFGLRNNVAVVATDTTINVNAGLGDIDDVFDSGAAGSSLTLLGASSLLADSVEEGADLILDGSTTATMGGQGVRIVADGSTITLETTDAVLNVLALDPNDISFEDARPFLIDGRTGLTYATDPNAWTVTNWNGSDAVTLQLAVPEPASAALLLAGTLLLRRGRSSRA